MCKTLQVPITTFHPSLKTSLGITRVAKSVQKMLLCLSQTCSHRVLFPVDGVFGQCQELAGADLYTYDISSSALQRLRVILQKLAYRGTNCLPVFVHNVQPLVKTYSQIS